jgi:DNA modification methylase
LWHGDSAEVLQGLPDASIDLAVYSPPFDSLFTYSPSERDIGNCHDEEEFFRHYAYVTQELYRVMKPGRIICVHCMDLPLTKATHGIEGMRNFSGALVNHHIDQGFVYRSRITIDRCPQQLAIRNKSKSLLFVQMDRDRAWLAPAFPDYLLVFRKPGENAVPVRDDSLTREEWIQWARPIWYNVRETNTLNVQQARADADERHVCPLSLDNIERCVSLYTNRGEIVLDPFNGISSTGVQSLLMGRRYVGVELKQSYFATGVKNLREAERQSHEPTLFDDLEETAGFVAEAERGG